MTNTKPPSVFDQIVEALPPHAAIERLALKQVATWTSPAGVWRVQVAGFHGMSVQGPGLSLHPLKPDAAVIIGTLRLYEAIPPEQDIELPWASEDADNDGVYVNLLRHNDSERNHWSVEVALDSRYAYLPTNTGRELAAAIVAACAEVDERNWALAERSVQPRTSERDDEQRIADALEVQKGQS